jgi:hypothetical protein
VLADVLVLVLVDVIVLVAVLVAVLVVPEARARSSPNQVASDAPLDHRLIKLASSCARSSLNQARERVGQL